MNKRVKEIKGVVSGWHTGTIFVRLEDHDGRVSIGDKVTIFHKLPERKAEISESQFDEAWEDTKICGYVTPETLVKKLKEKLFGSET